MSDRIPGQLALLVGYAADRRGHKEVDDGVGTQ